VQLTENWLVAMPLGHRLAGSDLIAVSGLADEDFVTAHAEFGPGCHQQTQEMFAAAGVRPRIVGRAFRRLTILMLVHSGAGVTLVPGSFASGALDGIVTRPLNSGEYRMRIAAAYPEGDMQGIVARFLRIAHAVVSQSNAD
jgi:DNA-binding transcriptional LysR family regulator